MFSIHFDRNEQRRNAYQTPSTIDRIQNAIYMAWHCLPRYSFKISCIQLCRKLARRRVSRVDPRKHCRCRHSGSCHNVTSVELRAPIRGLAKRNFYSMDDCILRQFFPRRNNDIAVTHPQPEKIEHVPITPVCIILGASMR